MTVLLIFLLISSLTGCARSVGSIRSARDAFHAGRLDEAQQTLTKIASKRGSDAVAAALDLAMVKMAAGDFRGAEQDLRRLRDRFDMAPQRSLIRDSASMLTDDNTRAFRPAGYEEVMIRAMLAVCSLADDAVDAESYALQATLKQKELKDAAAKRGLPMMQDSFQPIALAPYLRGVMREATHHDYDDATKAYRLVSAVRPSFSPAGEDIQRATTGAHSQPGHGVLYVIACVGEGPRLEESIAETTSTALTIASAAFQSQNNKDSDGKGHQANTLSLPNIASVKVPQVVIPTSSLAAIGVRVEGVLYGATQTLTDVGDLARRQNEAEMPWTIARAVLRRVTKEAAVAKLGDSLGLEGSAESLFHFAAASAWSGSEHADTRCWGLLPREIQVLRAELPVGQHLIALEPLGFEGGAIAKATTRVVNMVDGRNTYAIVIAPGP